MAHPDTNEFHQSGERFDRIERKLDSLAETVVSLARAEEKLIALERTNAVVMTTLMDLDKRMTASELVQLTLANSYKNFSKLFWSILSGASTTGVIWWVSQHMK